MDRSSFDPLAGTLEADLVLIIAGNLHLLRSLRILGPGRLMVGVGGWPSGDLLRAGDVFSGAAEGSCSVWLGLPGVATDIACGVGWWGLLAVNFTWPESPMCTARNCFVTELPSW